MSCRPSLPFFLVCHVVSATAAVIAAQLAGREVGDKMFANLIFFVCLAGIMAIFRTSERPYRLSFLFGFLGFALLAVAGTTIAFSNYEANWQFLFRFMGDLGFYPLHADAWLPLTAALWTASTLPLSVAALGAGRALRMLADAASEQRVATIEKRRD